MATNHVMGARKLFKSLSQRKNSDSTTSSTTTGSRVIKVVEFHSEKGAIQDKLNYKSMDW